MPTQATHRIAFGESDAKAPAGLHTKELAGSHDCELLGAPTGQSSTASCEAKADRALPVTISNRKVTKTMTIDTLDNLAPGEDGVQEQNSCPKTTPTGSNVVAASCDLSPVIDGNIESTTPVSPETKAGAAFATPANTAPPDENEQVCSPQAEPPSVLSSDSSHGEDETSFSSDSITPSVPAGQCIHMSVRGDETTNNTTNTMSTNNDIPTVPADDESAATQMNNATAADVESATGSSTTNNSAAALASANLNSGTDCATTSDTTMNKSYTTKCSVVRHNKPSFNVIAPMSDEPQMITLSYSKGHPSSSGDVHPSINRQCYHDGNTIVSASGSVDDSVSISAPGLDYTSSSGATHSFGAMGTSVPAGYYDVSVTHSNIQSHPAGNVSVLTGSVGPVQFRTIVPDENEEVVCDECTGSCKLTSTTDGGSQPGSTRAVENITIVPFTSSSGGSGVVRTANARHMRFAFAFGSFRGMGNVPSGQPEIVAFNYDASLLTPAALTYKHPLASVLVPEGDSVDANEGFRIFDGAAYANYIVTGDGSKAFAVGATSKKSEVVRFVSAISKDDSVVCNLSDASYVRVSSADDSAVFYYLNGENKNEFAAYISPDGATIEADEKLSIIRDTETGIIRQIWNYWDGLADVVPATEGNGYTISLYLPSQLTAPVEDGQLFTFAGDPFKTFTISGDAETQSMTIRERDWSLPENTPDYVTTWTHSEAGWNKVIGEEDDVISETRVKSPIEDSDDYQIVTTVSKGGVVASCVCEVFTSSVNGELCISRTEAYGSDIAQTTTFEYDEAGREVKRVAHHGGVYETVYDKYGRVTVESSPWAGGQKRLTSTIYREANSYNSDPAKIVLSVVSSSGSVTDLRTDTYTYTENDSVRRVEINSTAAGSSFTQNKVEETWLYTAENVYARGRVKMRQEVNGVQTHYEYTASSAHNALYKVTAETRTNGQVVAGQSQRTVDFISAEGNTMRTEEYVLLSDGETWALISGITNNYDEKNRLVGTVKDNGRSTSRILNCSGQPLSETDEHGVTTIYGYNTARQLIEEIREEIRDGNQVVTPETITTYTNDAMGQILSTREDIGAMTSIETFEYDLLGRLIREVDELGRVTTTVYSLDGLTETITEPSGATLISSKNTDGTIARIAGSGQREITYSYELNGSNERVTEKLADGSIVSQSITNGFGQEVVNVSAATGNRYIYTRSEYNSKGQIIKQYQDTGWNTTPTAPTVFEYDLFGNLSKKILKLADEVDTTNSPILEISIGVESDEDGVFERITQTRNAANGNLLTHTEKNLISSLSETVENIQKTIDERGKTSIKKTLYLGNGKVCVEETIPTSNIISETIYIDDFAISHRDHNGLTSSYTRAYSSAGFHITKTDSRGNNYTEYYDIHERIVQTTDGANNSTYTEYDERFDSPCLIREEDGSSMYYKYDERERLIAEWGTATQPATYMYDDDDRLISAISYREEDGLIVDNPENIESSDITSWEYDNVTGLEIKKIYADGSFSSKTYDSFNRLASETNARGITKYYEYEHARGLLTEINYSNNENNVSFSYDILGQLITVYDNLGERTVGYNEFSEQVSDVFISGTTTHEVCEKIDSFGRNSGYTYSKNNSVQQNITLTYDASGLLATVSFTHAGNEKTFSYEYLQNSNLIHMITYPNNMKLVNGYETNRDLLINMTYKRGETRVAERTYVHDNMERPISCTSSRLGLTHQDSFSYNNRSEMVAAYMHGDNYSYSFDNAGNRTSYQKNTENVVGYITNNLNQYTSIGNYSPIYDLDGNQTRVKTSTGEWSITYNADGRPVAFVNTEMSLAIECGYDFLGRRLYKKVTQNGEIITYQRYIYRGYLQIAACDMSRDNEPCLWLINWDPSQGIATRPLSIQKDATWYTYGVDLSKNIAEVYGPNGYIRTSYSYSPSGECVCDGDVSQPIQWSSEFVDEETGLVYYNFRHYNPLDGRWLSRDDIDDTGNIYCYTNNNFFYMDALGLSKYHWHHLIPNTFFKKEFRKCLVEIAGLSGEAIFNGIFLTVEQHRRIHRKVNNGGEWNKNIRERLKGIKCCSSKVLKELADELRKEVQDEYGGLDVDIDKDEWDRKSPQDKDKHTDELEKKKKKKNKKKKKSKKKNSRPKKTPTPRRAAGRAAGRILAKKGAKMAVKFALKKVPVVGWGFAAYGAYKGFRSGGIRGAIIGALF